MSGNILSKFSGVILTILIGLGAFSAATAAPGPVACAGPRTPTTPVPAHHLSHLADLDRIAPANSGVKAVRSGAWSDSATWGGKAPTSRVLIPAGISVVFDLANSPKLKTVRVEGCLELSSTQSSRLNTEFLYVAPKGELLAGTAANPIPANIVAEIVFPDFGAIDVKTDPTLVGKGLVSASRVRLYGALKTTRAKVSRDPKKGDSVLALTQAPSGWRVGDRVVITGTRWIPQTLRNRVVIASPTEDEIRYIRAVSGSTVTLSAPLTYDHPSPHAAVAAYVVNYSRNIRLATENGAALPASRRAHSMYMTPEVTLQALEFFEMGRTDKSIRGVDAHALSNPTPTSNVKGRYPVHLHKTGFPADDAAPVIRDSAIWGSPGWGVTHHQANAFLFDNATWNTFGVGFMSESGNETGAWAGNTAIKAIGLPRLVKDGSDIKAYDLGRTGDGFWLQSRMVRVHNNVAAGMSGGMGFVFAHRGSDLPTKTPITPAFAANSLCQASSMGFINQGISRPNIQQFTDNEVIASEVGFHVVKSNPKEPHDLRSVLDNFKAWEVRHGVELTYTARYTVKNALLIGSSASGGVGVKFGKNAYDLALVDSLVANFGTGVDLAKVTSRSFFVTNFNYIVSGVVFKNISGKTLANRDATDQVLTTTPSPKKPGVSYSWGSSIPYIDRSGARGSIDIGGTKADTSGNSTYPSGPHEFIFRRSQQKGLMAYRGWYRLANGERAIVKPEFYADRLTGEIEQGSFIARLDQWLPVPSRRVDGAPADRGSLNPKAGPPTARNDSVSVGKNGVTIIRAFANDTSNDGALIPAGWTHARNGNVVQLANGDLQYMPFPDYQGVDSFSYWVSNRQGFVAKATVAVTVGSGVSNGPAAFNPANGSSTTVNTPTSTPTSTPTTGSGSGGSSSQTPGAGTGGDDDGDGDREDFVRTNMRTGLPSYPALRSPGTNSRSTSAPTAPVRQPVSRLLLRD
ncbi:MAG: G8 domain-containing protein [Parvularculaceae bacterium]